jgi:orotidine-5'-phosphate decarboxylase
VLTPAEALAEGSTYLVIGRPVTRAEDPLAALQAINHSISRA